MTYSTPKNKSEYKSLVDRYLLRKDQLKQQFLEEKIGQADFQFESARLFKPVTSTIATTGDVQVKALKTLQEAQEDSAKTNENLIKAITYQNDNLAQIMEGGARNPFQLTALTGSPSASSASWRRWLCSPCSALRKPPANRKPAP